MILGPWGIILEVRSHLGPVVVIWTWANHSGRELLYFPNLGNGLLYFVMCGFIFLFLALGERVVVFSKQPSAVLSESTPLRKIVTIVYMLIQTPNFVGSPSPL